MVVLIGLVSVDRVISSRWGVANVTLYYNGIIAHTEDTFYIL